MERLPKPATGEEPAGAVHRRRVADDLHPARSGALARRLAVTENGDAPATTTNWHEHVADEGYYRP